MIAHLLKSILSSDSPVRASSFSLVCCPATWIMAASIQSQIFLQLTSNLRVSEHAKEQQRSIFSSLLSTEPQNDSWAAYFSKDCAYSLLKSSFSQNEIPLRIKALPVKKTQTNKAQNTHLDCAVWCLQNAEKCEAGSDCQGQFKVN